MYHRIFNIGDIHLGLTTDGVDRTDEIEKILDYFVEQVDDSCKYSSAIDVVFNGDIFENNHPSSKHIKMFIQYIFKLLDIDRRVKVYVLVGNHDALASNEKSCLTFINALSQKYKRLKLIDEPKLIHKKTTDVGPLYYMFLPHINKGPNSQEILDKSARKFYEKIGPSGKCVVFSHLNVKDLSIRGIEDSFLKRSDVFVPEFLLDIDNTQYQKPVILNNHIHKRGIKDNLILPGSPIFTDFKEVSKHKYFLEVVLSAELSKSFCKFKFKKTPARKFKELYMVFKDSPTDLHTNSEVKKFIDDINQDDFVKFNFVCSDSVTYDFKKFADTIENKTKSVVKPITPKIMKTKRYRDSEQKSNLDPFDAVKVYVKNNSLENNSKRLRIASDIMRGV